MEPDESRHPETADADSDLVRRMGAGDRQAFALLFHRHQRTVYRFALQMTGQPDVAEDVAQDVFLALARAGHRYQPSTGRLSTYLYGVARHLVLQRARTRRLRAETDLDDAAADRLVCWRDPADDLLHAARRAAIRRALLQLPPRYREVIVLCELNGVTYDDAATIVGCPIGTIRSRLSRGRRLLAARCRAAESPATASAVTLAFERPARAMEPQS